jgi:hypothetical protein
MIRLRRCLLALVTLVTVGIPLTVSQIATSSPAAASGTCTGNFTSYFVGNYSDPSVNTTVGTSA